MHLSERASLDLSQIPHRAAHRAPRAHASRLAQPLNAFGQDSQSDAGSRLIIPGQERSGPSTDRLVLPGGLPYHREQDWTAGYAGSTCITDWPIQAAEEAALQLPTGGISGLLLASWTQRPARRKQRSSKLSTEVLRLSPHTLCSEVTGWSHSQTACYAGDAVEAAVWAWPLVRPGAIRPTAG